MLSIKCRKCKRNKSSTDFHAGKRQCKSCVSEYYHANKKAIRDKQKKWYTENKETKKEYVKEWRANNPAQPEQKRTYTNDRRAKLKEKCVEYMGGGGKDCGVNTNHYRVYDFHHLDTSTKLFSISTGGRSKSWEKVKNELDKCEMLCANCHRMRH